MMEANKVLIAYFSHSGTTLKVVNVIKRKIDGKVFQIETAEEYPKNYNEVVEIAKKEKAEDKRPELNNKVDNMGDYDVVILAYPNWWGTLPMAVFSFLQRYDFSRKTILPICTHGGGGFGRSIEDIRRVCPNSKVCDGLAISANTVDGARIRIQQWLTISGL